MGLINDFFRNGFFFVAKPWGKIIREIISILPHSTSIHFILLGGCQIVHLYDYVIISISPHGTIKELHAYLIIAK